MGICKYHFITRVCFRKRLPVYERRDPDSSKKNRGSSESRFKGKEKPSINQENTLTEVCPLPGFKYYQSCSSRWFKVFLSSYSNKSNLLHWSLFTALKSLLSELRYFPVSPTTAAAIHSAVDQIFFRWWTITKSELIWDEGYFSVFNITLAKFHRNAKYKTCSHNSPSELFGNTFTFNKNQWSRAEK